MTRRSRPNLPASSAIAVAALALALVVTDANAAGGDPTPSSGSRAAWADDFALRVEPGLVLPPVSPRSTDFELGGGQTVKALWPLDARLEVGPSVTFVALPASGPRRELVTAWTFGASLRFKRAHGAADDDGAFAISPWVDADALYVRTGSLDRPGFAAAVGVSVPIGPSRIVWIGPFVRYLHVFQVERHDFDGRYGQLLILGVGADVGAGDAARSRAPSN